MKSMTQRARHVVTLALIGILCFQVPVQSFAQVGQTSMSQPSGVANGVVNRGLGALGSLNDAGPGFFYYGVNGAGRGLGYFGSYMTLGGFIPYAQDDLGGFWSADLRTHLSTNGGFFSNVGVVRKQLTDNGSLLGFGLYWDYDGDMNQYSGTGDAIYGQFGHVYQQIGVSGEILTDRGAIRSNGYMPVGTTAYNVGSPGNPFTKHYILCAYGLDAALGGADLEVGAWIPKLEAFGGMISVGGYTFGNANEWSQGPDTGDRMVPFFGGVYTRFDITVANNWDINLQYNNDPFFDSTGFARLTYRMGGSRRRNVPDQLEQPMMRNEHIVRGHQTPLVCGNRVTGNPWQVIHVDNTAAAGGNGTYEAPFTTLQEAQDSKIALGPAGVINATNKWNIFYVHEGNSTQASGKAYGGEFAFPGNDQFLVGSGGPLTIQVGPDCGTLINGNYLFTIPKQTTNNPLLSNPAGTSVNTNGKTGSTIANLTITASGTALLASGNMTSPLPAGITSPLQPAGTTANPLGLTTSGATAVRNVTMSGDGTTNPQRGVWLNGASADLAGDIEFTDTSIGNMNNTSFRVDGKSSAGAKTGNANINFSGSLTSDVASNGGVPSPIIDINNMAGGTINLASSGAPSGSFIPNQILDVGGDGVVIELNETPTNINIGSMTLVNSVNTAIAVLNDDSTTKIETVPNTTASPLYTSGIVKNTDGSAIVINGASPEFEYFGTISNTPPAGIGLGYLTQIAGVADAKITISGPGNAALSGNGDGIFINNVTGDSIIDMKGISLTGEGSTGILVTNSTTTAPTATENYGFNFSNVLIGGVTGPTAQGVLLSGNTATTTLNNIDISLPGASADAIRAVDAGIVLATGANTLFTASTTNSAIYAEGSTEFTSGGATPTVLNFVSVESDNVNTAATPTTTPRAITIADGTPSGLINITGDFTVGGIGGTADNIENAAGSVTVDVSGTQISP